MRLVSPLPRSARKIIRRVSGCGRKKEDRRNKMCRGKASDNRVEPCHKSLGVYAQRDIITAPIRHPARYIAALSSVGNHVCLYFVLGFLFTTDTIIHNKYLRRNEIMNDFPRASARKRVDAYVRERSIKRQKKSAGAVERERLRSATGC